MNNDTLRHPWQLVAYPSTTDGLCFSITPKVSGAEPRGGGMACGPVAGVSRTPATKAKMAERIVRTASNGVTTPDELLWAAVEEGREPAA